MSDVTTTAEAIEAAMEIVACCSPWTLARDDPNSRSWILACERALNAIALAAVAEQPCYERWNDGAIGDGYDDCEQQIADMIKREQELGITYVDRDRRCSSCTARAALTSATGANGSPAPNTHRSRREVVG